MRGRAFSLALLLALSLSTLTSSFRTAAAGPALLFEQSSGRVLYAEDIDDQWHPASLTKIMTAYVVFQAIKAGQITHETRIPVSEAAFAQPPSKIGLPVGADMTVETALQALIVKSANDVAVMLAEAVGGTEAGFVERMNATARALGMTRTHYVNANGLPADEQITTARDLARISRAVLTDFPQYAHYWALSDMHIGKIRINTHNGLLRSVVGADGMKTGFICDSGYNVVASATRDGVRMIAVVLGESSTASRNIRAQSLLEHGFQTYGWQTMFSNATVDNLPIASDAHAVTSVRNTVMATECGWHRPRVARKRPKSAADDEHKTAAVATAQPPATAAATPPRPQPKPKATAAAPAVTNTGTQ